jgi:RNA ligase (TIGR02306 family)
MNQRKLASIQYVHTITPIERADKIELAHVEGWQVVCPKGNFKVGDLAVYFEIDSFLPIDDRYEFLRKSCYKKNSTMGEGFKIRTMKMCGEISQGLLLPVSDFPEITEPQIGEDVTELLHVKKWEVEERATTGGTIIGQLPADIPHTDETRVQNEPELIKELGQQTYYITTKMDGSSHSIEIDSNNEFHVTGHNYEYKDDGNSAFYEFVKKHNFEEEFRKLKDIYGCQSIVVQGEFCAPGIQKNRLKLTAPDWFIFTVMIDGKRQTWDIIENTANFIGANHVPLEEVGEGFDKKYPTVEAVLARADKSMYHVGVQESKAEGIVIRPFEPVWSKTIDDWLSMKAVSNKYLLKNE